MKTENIMVRISPQLKQQAKAQAEQEGKTLSEYILDLVKADIQRKTGLPA